MKSIQELREERYELTAEARKLMDDNPGSKFTPKLAAKFEEMLAEVDKLDREIMAKHNDLQDLAEKYSVANGVEWRNAVTGKNIPVAFASKGSISAQLKGAFQSAHGEGKASIGDFLRGVAGIRSTETVRNSLSVGTDSSGGYMLPAYLQLQMLDALVPASSLLTAGAGMSMLEEGAKSHRIAAVNTVPTAAWRSESGALATSDPVFRSVDILPRSLSFQFKVSRELLNDTTNLEQALFTAIAQAFAKELDRAGLRGTGTAPEIRGILNTSGIQSVTNGANGASLATTAYANLVSAMQSIITANAPIPTAAIMSPRSMAILAGLLDTRRPPGLSST